MPGNEKGSRINKRMYKQKCFILLGKGFKGCGSELSKIVGCTEWYAVGLKKEWQAMDANQKSFAMRKALAELKEAQEAYPDVDWGAFAKPKEPEHKPEPVVKWGFRNMYSAQKQPRTRSLISRY